MTIPSFMDWDRRLSTVRMQELPVTPRRYPQKAETHALQGANQLAGFEDL